MNDVEINVKRAKKMYPTQKKKAGGKPYSTEQLQEILKCLNSTFSLPMKSTVLIMASSGCRVGFAEYLKVKHIGEFEKNGCKSILVYGGDKEEYHSFINSETVKVIDEWIKYRKSNGEIITGESWVIPQAKDHTKPMYERGIHGSIYEKIKHIDRGEKIGVGSGARYETSITHGIRKRWNTIAKNTDGVNSNKVEKMYGHSTTHALDDTYYKPELSDLFKEYEKFSDRLVVSKEDRLELELLRKDEIIEENQAQKDDKIKSLEDRLERFEAFMKSTVKFD
jgi:integrase